MKYVVSFLTLALSAATVLADFEKGIAAERIDDHVTAFNEWKPLAAKGNPAAQYQLGNLYEYGLGVTQNIQTAIELYTKSARQGNADAMNKLGDILSRSFPGNHEKAAMWYEKAATKYRAGIDKGRPEDQYGLGLLYETGRLGKRDYVEALNWLRKAAEQGYVPAYVEIGAMYSIGTEATSEDQVESAKWFRMAAEAGDAKSMSSLASKYERGEGVPADTTQAAAWYRKSAEHGNRWELNHLGFLYGYASNGFPRDLVLAYTYFKLACDNRFFCRPDRKKSANENIAKIKKIMSLEQIKEGDQLAANWQLGTSLPSMSKTGLVSQSIRTVTGAPSNLKNCEPPVGQPLRYSDSCINGDCVRTFNNGCQKRFQAQYCYDQLQERWDWKPNGC